MSECKECEILERKIRAYRAIISKLTISLRTKCCKKFNEIDDILSGELAASQELTEQIPLFKEDK